MANPHKGWYHHFLGNRKWLPPPGKKTFDEDYRVELPKKLKPGNYTLRLKL